MGNNEFRKLSLWGGLVTLALLGSTVAWSRSTSHPVPPERQGASASESQSSAPIGYVVRTIEQSRSKREESPTPSCGSMTSPAARRLISQPL